MTTFSFILVLALAVIVSALINQVVHGVSTPLIQIAIGVAISFFGFTASNFSLDPELFLVLFIAPLLYDEARQVDKVALWSNRTVILAGGRPRCRHNPRRGVHAQLLAAEHSSGRRFRPSVRRSVLPMRWRWLLCRSVLP
ncbi:MAG: hypothetical protein ACLT98_03565 [Eggerthellaceae bacterium]